MKKLIASVMMICLLCCAAVVIAETNTSGIMFLDIPWGSSVKEVQGHLEARANNDLSFEKSKPEGTLASLVDIIYLHRVYEQPTWG